MISLALIFRARTGQLFSRRSLSLDLFHSVDSGCTFSVATPRTMVSCESGYTHTWGLGRACLHYDFSAALHSCVSVIPGEGEWLAFDGGDYSNEFLADCLLPGPEVCIPGPRKAVH